MEKSRINQKMRKYHRHLGYFLAGIMAVYSISGIILIFRDTDFLKSEKQVEKKLQPDMKVEDLGKALKIKDFKIRKTEGSIVYFEQGTYDTKTNIAKYKSKELPLLITKMNKLHKATSGEPLFFLNVFFGVSLLFFVLSAFWMFLPKTEVFKKGVYFALAGVALTILLLFV